MVAMVLLALSSRLQPGERYLHYSHVGRESIHSEEFFAIREMVHLGVSDRTFAPLSKLIPIGQRMLRRAVRSFGEHYHQERNHQGLCNALITLRPVSDLRDGPVVRRPRLGGLLNFYERAAA